MKLTIDFQTLAFVVVCHAVIIIGLHTSVYSSDSIIKVYDSIASEEGEVVGTRIWLVPSTRGEKAISQTAQGSMNALRLSGLKRSDDGSDIYLTRDTQMFHGKFEGGRLVGSWGSGGPIYTTEQVLKLTAEQRKNTAEIVCSNFEFDKQADRLSGMEFRILYEGSSAAAYRVFVDSALPTIPGVFLLELEKRGHSYSTEIPSTVVGKSLKLSGKIESSRFVGQLLDVTNNQIWPLQMECGESFWATEAGKAFLAQQQADK